jgi:hypothetical protein
VCQLKAQEPSSESILKFDFALYNACRGPFLFYRYDNAYQSYLLRWDS